MMLREAIEQYIRWRQAHGARFSTGANLLRRFLEYADGDAACDTVVTAHVLAFLTDKGPLTRTVRTSITFLPAFGVMRSAAGTRAVAAPDNEPSAGPPAAHLLA